MTKTLGLLLSTCLAACAGQAEVRYSGSSPELVAMDSDPSVMVVANSDEPVFFSENTYWLYRDQRWYHSHSSRGGWARVDHPPDHVQRIQQPASYVHFRGTRAAQNERERLAEPARTPAEEVAPRRDTRPDEPLGPRHEPNSQGPNQPYSNPLPPHQVPPVPDNDRAANGDPSRAPLTPGMRNRGADQRPAADRDDHRGGGPAADAPPPPIR